MKVKDVMTREVETVRPDTSAKETAEKMKSLNIGSIPVCENDAVVGTITDRDLTIRVLAEGRDPQETKVAEVMTRDVKTCRDEDDLEQAEKIMHDEQIRRLPVVGQDGKLKGYISTAKIARTEGESQTGRILKGISQSEKPAPLKVARSGRRKQA